MNWLEKGGLGLLIIGMGYVKHSEIPVLWLVVLVVGLIFFMYGDDIVKDNKK